MIEEVEWNAEDAGKNEYDLCKKEIHEQHARSGHCLRNRITEFESRIILEESADLECPKRIFLVAYRTSYQLPATGRNCSESTAILTQSLLSSEYRTEVFAADAETPVTGVTQSGESADTVRVVLKANSVDPRH
ncbi:hypothetical protein QA600_19615 [Natronococcus sp. A-GB1]|uniref:hypothetical protein n=1 Tax=Natronococcus sp. A-GB1 TaxID=3037648 RepID=UPI00241E4046|nr:hypothetical protein [Natronococcus sp. A-GB1]MDG5761543.1 hypothetical protein [Natronococcus sp. A-GB1]